MPQELPGNPLLPSGQLPGNMPDSEVMSRSRDEPELFALLFRRHATALGRYVCLHYQSMRGSTISDWPSIGLSYLGSLPTTPPS
jgi:hypothetical protein